MALVKRTCDNPKCNKEYEAREADLNRGWGKCCSKSCAAFVRELAKGPKKKKRTSLVWDRFSMIDDYDPGDDEYWMNKDFS